MNAKEFTLKIIQKYQAATDRELSYEELGLFLCEILEDGSIYEAQLNKKTAARILHEFIKNVLRLPDVDWGDAVNFKDIYDCRVCANALAQCYNRKLIFPRVKTSNGSNILGIDDTISDKEAEMIISVFLC